MRIVSWNINGIRAVGKRGFIQWLQEDAPDILCLQETKARPEQLSQDVREPAGYHSYWASAKKAGYSGVAIYSKEMPFAVDLLGEPEFDDEGRILVADYQNFALICAYFPNSQDGGARLPYKMRFCDAVMARCNALVDKRRHVILCGDYNIAHTPLDLARPEDNEGSPGYFPEERAWMDTFIGAGYVDTFRRFHQGESGHYSWWSYRTHARERNVGWRIDYHCVDMGLLPRIQGASIRAEVEGSDHCPVELLIKS
ncbi:MAG: exodeoxyribonuclease III [Treponema sp.]|jgi:exodeoxyribonuclease-3|nr:exodeoxyribonuclease III [Treponema sp.]